MRRGSVRRGSVRRSIGRRIALLIETLAAILREIFDESAYARFLTTKGLISSRAAYAEFIHETEHARARRPRCC